MNNHVTLKQGRRCANPNPRSVGTEIRTSDCALGANGFRHVVPASYMDRGLGRHGGTARVFLGGARCESPSSIYEIALGVSVPRNDQCLVSGEFGANLREPRGRRGVFKKGDLAVVDIILLANSG